MADHDGRNCSGDKAGKTPASEAEKMRIMHLWLEAVCHELNVDPDLLNDIAQPALGLISDVAHGPSRPGAPMTALALGLATQPGEGREEIASRITRLVQLARTWEAPTP
ncbi:DUF6457 domain-containing protein [Dermatophilus congolensis]|uniref:DUF6457 domain-containing protein n=1 Tax=Dermatophilus congolensis TaxID=1863 RepID=UPI001AAEC2CF|nr:molybdopterin-guanine dinucleotide biosynthesis protein [Dermatophilus congolensis]MBO3132567.1 molybdopterin-guanine dinucleotide biosynthesis protein [Dermatophilus congolensis]MBO3133274.1 molybdopterin-guanine dinucleotide biosynthesis protein [Dermatophilus congolensis]MBO3135508.1 molybdopterin-guanine dinucleotide biosynthesis protein [Dermatophilus congolensis]MBO3137746.1 molybdopterin-guanine dinucleotide biosynthesis protein [Dermatophilus congolensis]